MCFINPRAAAFRDEAPLDKSFTMQEDCLNDYQNYSCRHSPHTLASKHSIQRVVLLSQTFPFWSQTHKHWILLLSQPERSLTSRVLINGWRYWNQIVSMHTEDYRQVSRFTVLKIRLDLCEKSKEKQGYSRTRLMGHSLFYGTEPHQRSCPFHLCALPRTFLCTMVKLCTVRG